MVGSRILGLLHSSVLMCDCNSARLCAISEYHLHWRNPNTKSEGKILLLVAELGRVLLLLVALSSLHWEPDYNLVVRNFLLAPFEAICLLLRLTVVAYKLQVGKTYKQHYKQIWGVTIDICRTQSSCGGGRNNNAPQWSHCSCLPYATRNTLVAREAAAENQKWLQQQQWLMKITIIMIFARTKQASVFILFLAPSIKNNWKFSWQFNWKY